ncbi:MAG TPA: ACP S-malonyltransferase [Acidisarcina sp.]
MIPSKTAFLFPGQNSQSIGMGRDLYDRFPTARQTFQEADKALGFSISALCFEGPEEQLRRTEFQQPAIFTVSVAALRVLAEHGVRPEMVAGHSLGEYAANVAASSLAFADGVRTVRSRGRYMQDAVPEGVGAMAAVLGLGAEEVIAGCATAAAESGEVVSAANINSPTQIAISGTLVAVERAAAILKQAGARRVVMLKVSAPFHCALMQPAQDHLAALLQSVSFAEPSIPVAVNVDAQFVEDAAGLRNALVRQVTGAVRWVESMQLLIDRGATHFIEVGPGKVLSGLLRQIDPNQSALNVEDGASLEKTLEVLNPAGEHERAG